MCGQDDDYHPVILLADPPGGDQPRAATGAASGFSMVEVLIALAIVTIVGLGASQLVLGSVEVVKDSDFTTTASMLAMEKVEELRELDYGDPLLVEGTYTEDRVEGSEEFSRSWTIEEDVPRAGLKRITVRVTAHWGSRGQPRSVETVTYRVSDQFAESIRP